MEPHHLARCRIPPEGVPPYPKAHFAHQIDGIDPLVLWNDPPKGRIIGGVMYLGDETGMGKCKQIIDAAQILFVEKHIKRVVVLAPGAVRSVWADEELGELAKHLWLDLPCIVTEYHSRTRTWLWATAGSNAPRLEWYITNYEFLRSPARRKELLTVCDKQTLLVADESALIKNWEAEQTKGCFALRQRVGRFVEMNGTPVVDKPFDIFAQAKMMDPAILGISSMTKFKAAFAVMGGHMVDTPWGKMATEVLRWKNLDILQQRLAPYVIRREKKDCMDLPPKLEPVVISVPLKESWPHYKAMRDDMVSWLSDGSVSSAQQAITKIMRLAQITSGFIGGVEALEILDDAEREWGMGPLGERLGDGEQQKRQQQVADHFQKLEDAENRVVEIGSEKLDAFLAWLELKLDEDKNLKLLVQSRFRAEVARTLAALSKKYPGMELGLIVGAQSTAERNHAKRLMDPRATCEGPATVIMTSAGSVGLTLTASHTVFRMSRDTSLYIWKQGEDRVHRPTQVHPVSYYDLVATGPKGQRTIDKDILASLLQKDDVAQWTVSAWVTRMMKEEAA